MTAQEFRALLNLFMCSDPWPTDKKEENDIIEDLLVRESATRGYDSWVVAFHELKG